MIKGKESPEPNIIELYDSMPTDMYTLSAMKCLQLVQHWVESLTKNEWHIRIAPDAIKQEDNYSCGVWVIVNMKLLIHRPKADVGKVKFVNLSSLQF